MKAKKHQSRKRDTLRSISYRVPETLAAPPSIPGNTLVIHRFAPSITTDQVVVSAAKQDIAGMQSPHKTTRHKSQITLVFHLFLGQAEDDPIRVAILT